MSGSDTPGCIRTDFHSVPSECVVGPTVTDPPAGTTGAATASPPAAAIRGMWFPEMPPAMPGEGDDAYTNRLTGCLGEDLIPYDHDRNRECSIGFHETCSEAGLSPFEARADLEKSGRHCKCPCHTLWGHLALRVPELEEALAAIWLAAPPTTRKHFARIGVSLVHQILDAHPDYREWYAKHAVPDPPGSPA